MSSSLADAVLLTSCGLAALALAWTLVIIARQRASRAEMRAKLRKARDRLANALSGSNLAVWDWNAAEDRVYLSENWQVFLGGEPRPTETSLGQLAALVHPEDAAAVNAAFAAALRGATDEYAIEHRVRTLDGQWTWINSRGRVVARDAAGRVTRMTGTNAHTARRKRAEEALAASEERFRRYFELGLVGMAITSPGRGLIEVNDAFCLEDGQILGRSAREVLGDERYAAVQPYLRRALAGETVHYERQLGAPDGRPIDLSASYVPHLAEDGTVSGFYALLTDITELKVLDRMKSEFVSTVSHELRTPLTAIRGSLGLLVGAMEQTLPEPARKLIGIAHSSCERLVRLVNDILDIDVRARGEKGTHPRGW